MSQATKQSFTTFTVSGTTGSTCQKTGPYKSRSTPQVIVMMRRGARFPNGANNKATTWDLLKTGLATS
jgi:hypothetical protein